MLYPDNINGFAWGNATLKKNILKGLCGYYGRAPSDARGGSVKVAQDFATFLTTIQPPKYSGNRVLDAWLEANRGHSALGIAYDANQYWRVVRNPWKPWDWKVSKPKNWPH